MSVRKSSLDRPLGTVTIREFLSVLQDTTACQDMGVQYVPEKWIDLGRQTCTLQGSGFVCECPQERIILPAHYEPVPKKGYKISPGVSEVDVLRRKLKCKIAKDGNTLSCLCEPDGADKKEPLKLKTYTEERC